VFRCSVGISKPHPRLDLRFLTTKSDDTQKVEPQQKPQSGDKQNNNLRRGPITWKSAAFILATGAGLLYGLERYREQKRKEVMAKNTMTIGTPIVGGPYNLVDENGKPTTEKDFFGKYVMIYFGFTNCPDICPTELKKLERALKMIVLPKGVELQPVFISIDPVRDTPERLSKYKQGWKPSWKWLTGSLDEISKVAKSFRLYFSIPEADDDEYLVDHSIFFYLMDREGKVLEFYGKYFTDAELAEKAALKIKQDFRKG